MRVAESQPGRWVKGEQEEFVGCGLMGTMSYAYHGGHVCDLQ